MDSPDKPGFEARHAWRELERVEPPRRPASDRVSDFHEILGSYDEATARQQASRCILCPHPTCVAACPHNSPIPEMLALTADGNFAEAAELMFTSHSLPEVFAHICVGGHRCEAACMLGDKADPVPIGSIVRFLLDFSSRNGIYEPPVEAPNGQRIAVIGSGICGLVAAEVLSRKGYAVTVLDSHPVPGGRLMNGLPGFRVDKQLVQRRIHLLEQRGVRFRMGVTPGGDVSLTALGRDFDAVFFCLGRADAVPLTVPGAGLRGIHQAYPFELQHTTEAMTGQPQVDVRGRRVLVLGGGDTAVNVLRIAIRCGASEATCICRRDPAGMSANREEYALAAEEGARFLFLSQPVAIIGNAAGDVTHVRCVRMAAGDPDASGRHAVTPVTGSEFDVPGDVVLVAYGFTPPRLPATDEFASLTQDGRGCLIVDDRHQTSLPGVFAAGSIVHGAIPLTEAVRDARKAVASIDQHLTALRRGAQPGA
jgi:glutamate synthase (NADPH/NADH) small chain